MIMKLIRQFIITVSLITYSGLYSQEVLICDNGGFESGGTEYTFWYETIFTSVDCNFDQTTMNTYTLTFINDFSLLTEMTLVDNDVTISNGNDPAMYALSIPIPRVNNDTLAMKLGNDEGRNDVAGLRKEFNVYEDVISFSYSLIMRTYSSLASTARPRFRARLYDNSGSVLDELCIEADPSDTDMFNIVYDSGDIDEEEPYLYTGWRCASLNVPLSVSEGDLLTLEILTIDGAAGFPFATAYIDDICNIPCCQECPDIEIDVPTGNSSHEAAETCLNLYNTVNDEAIVDYHAGFEVVMLPGEPLDPTAVPGFESLYGSDGYYHIKDCDVISEPEERQNMFIEQDGTGSLQIYPNPANSELNIVSGTDMVSLTLVALDGKVIIAKQLDGKNHKLDLNGIAQGVYILTVETGDGAMTSQKVIKN